MVVVLLNFYFSLLYFVGCFFFALSLGQLFGFIYLFLFFLFCSQCAQPPYTHACIHSCIIPYLHIHIHAHADTHAHIEPGDRPTPKRIFCLTIRNSHFFLLSNKFTFHWQIFWFCLLFWYQLGFFNGDFLRDLLPTFPKSTIEFYFIHLFTCVARQPLFICHRTFWSSVYGKIITNTIRVNWIEDECKNYTRIIRQCLSNFIFSKLNDLTHITLVTVETFSRLRRGSVLSKHFGDWALSFILS